MSTCPTNPIVITKGSRDTGLCQRDTNVNTNFGLTQNQKFANIVNNPYITRSCEENIIDETKTIDTSSDDDNDNFFETVVNVINQRHSDNTIPVGYENNINNALINIGGNILALGKHGDRNWVVGIQHPRKPNSIGSISLSPGWSIGTSGDYQRYFIVDNQRYSHLIDPNTGYPATNAQSATVLLPPIEFSGTLSDVYSKPLFIAPENLKYSIAKELGIDFYMIIMTDGKISISNDMLNLIKWHEEIDEKNITVH
jgi:thiamine biosynthesis lipoprotein